MHLMSRLSIPNKHKKKTVEKQYHVRGEGGGGGISSANLNLNQQILSFFLLVFFFLGCCGKRGEREVETILGRLGLRSTVSCSAIKLLSSSLVPSTALESPRFPTTRSKP